MMDLAESETMKIVLKQREYEESMTISKSCQVIGINFSESTPLLWRVAEVKAAREVGMIGTLVGSLGRQPRQNSRLGRPLELMQEEGRLLAELGRASLIPAMDPLGEDSKVSPEQVEQYQAGLECCFEEQNALALHDRKTALLRVMTEKQKEGSGSKDRAVRQRLDGLDFGFSLSHSGMAVQLCTARAGLGHCPEEHSFLAADWPMPQDEGSETRFHVFRDLRRQGYYLTSAGKFGGDYLVYPGDPLRFHAHFIAVCISMHEAMFLCDILAIARLGSNVKKTVLLCSPDEGHEDGSGEVVYTSLQWSGMI